MPSRTLADLEILDGNEAVARVAYALSEVVAIYPITPASPMAEWADAWSSEGRPNLWGAVPSVVQMQSEGGAAGAVHGALTTGSLATTFTSSQGLLLMIPDMYKIAGELSPAVMHVAARSLATHALSIFGDHSDVMAARATGWAMLASGSVQEAADLALAAHAAALESRLPTLHFFDGFRTSHELATLRPPSPDVVRAMIDDARVLAHRRRALTPERPTVRGTAQNPDVFFQSREAANPYYLNAPGVFQRVFDRLAGLTGRAHRLFDYVGRPDAERVLVMMGSGAGAAEEAVQALAARGEKVGLVKVRLFRPFSARHLADALPRSVRSIAVLDRTKEPGAGGEPLFLDVLAAIEETLARDPSAWPARPRLVGGRYGLSSKEFTPGMAAAALAELAKESPKSRFTLGIVDDVTGLSLAWDPNFLPEPPEVRRIVLYGLGSDGTVGAAKSTLKLAAREAGLNAQGYCVYDSKKSGSMTASHLRLGPEPIRSTYLIRSAELVACHHESLLENHDLLASAAPGGIFLLNTTAAPEKAFDRLPRAAQEALIVKRLRFFAIDAFKAAREAGLGGRISGVMQACLLHLTRLVSDPEAAARASVTKTFASKGAEVVRRNLRALEGALAGLREIPVPASATAPERAPFPSEAPEFVRRVTAELLAGRGDLLPVSALPPDGVFPDGTARWEKRDLAAEIPAWEEAACTQCNKCALVCPHAAIRAKAYPADALAGAPEGFQSVPWRGRDFPAGTRYTLQVAPEDCTACGLCVEICPAPSKAAPKAKALAMTAQPPRREAEKTRFAFFERLPEAERRSVNLSGTRGTQLVTPLFEFSGACAGCGETPYLKLLTQLFGDRLLIANATGCSSIYGGNLPTAPWTAGKDGRGPAWANSLFEDNAEFGLGFRLSLDHQRAHARELLRRLAPRLDGRLADALLDNAGPEDDAALSARREKIGALKRALRDLGDREARELLSLADALAAKSVWIVGGDGWAYDIGFGGLDHVLNSGRDVNVLVLDTEVYSNTGGQASKATPRAAVARFAASGKPGPRKSLALAAMNYKSVYVAQVALGANDAQALKAIRGAESYSGPSLVIAYAHCIAHGIEMSKGLGQQKLAVETGYWPLFRRDPRREAPGASALTLDSAPPSRPLEDFTCREGRYRSLAEARPERAKELLGEAQEDVRELWRRLEALARPR